MRLQRQDGRRKQAAESQGRRPRSHRKATRYAHPDPSRRGARLVSVPPSQGLTPAPIFQNNASFGADNEGQPRVGRASSSTLPASVAARAVGVGGCAGSSRADADRAARLKKHPAMIRCTVGCHKHGHPSELSTTSNHGHWANISTRRAKAASLGRRSARRGADRW